MKGPLKNRTSKNDSSLTRSSPVTVQQIDLRYEKGSSEFKISPKLTPQGKTLDIKLKKIKHKIVEGLDASTADALGISRAILCNDSLIRKLKGLDQKNQTVKVN